MDRKLFGAWVNKVEKQILPLSGGSFVDLKDIKWAIEPYESLRSRLEYMYGECFTAETAATELLVMAGY